MGGVGGGRPSRKWGGGRPRRKASTDAGGGGGGTEADGPRVALGWQTVLLVVGGVAAGVASGVAGAGAGTDTEKAQAPGRRLRTGSGYWGAE